jgi:acetyl-CoA synthetase
MVGETITKASEKFTVIPNLLDYEKVRAEFSWTAARKALDGLPGGRGLNIGHEAVDRNAAGSRSNHLAIRWLGKRGEIRDFTYAGLRSLTNRFANVLRSLGMARGERVFLLAGRIPELYISALGSLKNGNVFCPLFSAFGPQPIHQRVAMGDGRLLVTTPSLYKRKLANIRESLTNLKHVLLVGDSAEIRTIPGTLDFNLLMSKADEFFEIPSTAPEDFAILHFTSGTTGKPKGAMHVHEAVVAHYMTGYFALDLHPDDIFWCTADPGWVTGTSYGIVAPLTHGITSIVDEAEFDAEHWYEVLQKERVTVWYTAPTAVRMMMKVGTEVIRKYDLSNLRFIASVGEPLNSEAVLWGLEAFGLPIHDNWWQTETGGIMIANCVAMDIRPGSMGRPLPGIEASIVHRRRNGKIEFVTQPDEQGELALSPQWPSIFRGYLNDEARYRKCFADGWYLTGDIARRDAAGYFWFMSRADDVIKSSGHLIGPFEVESILLEHKVVAEAGVIGKPDPVAGEVVKAFVSLKPGFNANEELRRDLLGFARKRLGAVVAPKEIEFVQSVPKTRSGKIMRRLLKARELGLPEGDISTLEDDAADVSGRT